MSGKPAFTFCDFAGAASVTATDSLSGTDPNNVLLATEDTVWSPANASGSKDITIDLFTPELFNSTSFVGEELDELQVLTRTSTDNFISDEDLSLNTDVSVNGDFATGDLTGWTKNETNEITIAADVTGVTFTATRETGVVGDISQETLIPGRAYFVKLTIVSIDSGLRITVDGSISTGAAGTFTDVFVATSTTFSIICDNTVATVIGNAAKVTDIEVYEFALLSTDNNAAIVSHATTSADRYVKYTISNLSTSLQIAHICPDLLIEQPFLENDWGSEGIAPTFNNLISTGGLFLGNNQVRTMRDISIEFGEVTDTEFTNTVKPWVDSRIKVAKPFFFTPDVDNLDEVYFVWLEDNVGFTAPLRQGIRTVAPIAAKTRIA